MNYDEIDAGYRLNTSSSINFAPKESKACAGALRALQERLKQLEHENQEAKDKITVLESRNNSDREKWQIRMIEEIQLGKDKESRLQSQIQDRDEQLTKQASQILSLENQLKIKETHYRLTETESKKAHERYSIDASSYQVQIDLLQKSLLDKDSEEKSLQLLVQRIEREKQLIEEELKQERRISQSLQSEVDFLKENAERQKKTLEAEIEELDKEMSNQASESSQKIKELEIKNKSLRELTSNQSRQIEHMKKEISDLTKSRNLIDQKSESLKSKGDNEKKTPSKSLSKPNIFAKSPSKPQMAHKKHVSLTEVKNDVETEDEVRRMIVTCEKDLEKLNNMYRALISISQKETGDLTSVRADMTKLAEDIDKKSDELFTLKKRQQSFLRAKLVQNP